MVSYLSFFLWLALTWLGYYIMVYYYHQLLSSYGSRYHDDDDDHITERNSFISQPTTNRITDCHIFLRLFTLQLTPAFGDFSRNGK